jgi:hypothetical protein
VQAVLNILLLRREFDRTLRFDTAHEDRVAAIARFG